MKALLDQPSASPPSPPASVPAPAKTIQSTPEQALAFASRTASAVLAEAKKHRWVVRIQKSEYFCIEAWQALGAPYGITAAVTKIELLTDKDGNVIGAQAWAEARHNPTGRVWGQAVQVCMADETVRTREGEVIRRWEGKGTHALVGMASTRACSRALSQVLRWVATIAGVSGTPSEEM
jgi:hypothetical protein